MFPQDIIARKRDGHALSRPEIEAFVRGATDGSWADYQLSAMLMAVYLRGMTTEERVTLTDAMRRSGTSADLSSIPAPKCDKHSTGGVGDKVSLILAPLVAACGVAVPMISGRGLGHTGGTLDKLESIPGFNVRLPLDTYRELVARHGLCLIGQTDDLAPADRKLYALRDVTATVPSLPLICASIMSKKLAAGIDSLVLDVKFGRGAFLREKAQARELATAMVAIGTAMGKPTRALLTAMEQPLGRTAGHSLEVIEALDTLRLRGPHDLFEVTMALGVQMLLLARRTDDPGRASKLLYDALASGAALQKFRDLVAAQGGDARVCDDPSLLPAAGRQVEVQAPLAGFIQEVDALQVGRAVLALGGGRARAEDGIDHAVGVADLVKIGERVGAGGRLCTLHVNDPERAGEAARLIREAVTVGARALPAPPLIDELVT